jgi:hypothetical protein
MGALSAKATQLIVFIIEEKSSGMFSARLENGELLCRSRTPFFESARALLGRGHSPAAILAMRRTGTNHDASRALLGTAAGLSVEHDKLGHVRLRKWRGPRGSARRPRGINGKA